METLITLQGTFPPLSAGLLGKEERFFYLSFTPSELKPDAEFILYLSRIEAFTLWNFLDEALENPL